MALSEAEQELLCGRLVDRLRRGDGVELGEGRASPRRRRRRGSRREADGKARCRSDPAGICEAACSYGKAMQAASTSRSSRSPASSTRRETAQPSSSTTALCSWTVIPSRSFACRQASWRSGESGTPSRNSRARSYAACRSRCPLELEPDAVDDVALGAAQPRLRTRLPRRRDPGPAAASRRGRRTPAPTASSIPRRVASSPAASASKQRNSRRVEPRSSLTLPLGERRSHRRDDRLEPRLAQRDHVGVALDDDRAVLLRDRTRGRGGARRGSPTCGRARPRASSRTCRAAGRPRGACAPGSRRSGRARPRVGTSAGAGSSRFRARCRGPPRGARPA